MTRSGQSVFLKNDTQIMENIKFPSEEKYIRETSTKILEGLSQYGLDEDTIFDIKLCIEEAVRNAIVHVNKLDKKLWVKINYWVEGGKINIEIEDEGNGFKAESLPDPTSGSNLLKGSGRGVYLIKKLMDEVRFNASGNKITMVKNLQ